MSTSPTTSLPSRPVSSRPSRASSRASLKLDLSNLPPLSQPVTPTNTLLITNLNDLEIFRPDNLQTIKDLICQTAPVNSWSPLKSFRRIVCSFADEQAALKVRQIWDGEAIMGERCRVYFGQHTPLSLTQDQQHLALPDAGKLFFISPPPSPPCGWEMRLEDAPNKQVHAEDLAGALAKLHHRAPSVDSPISPVDGASVTGRSRSSTLIFQPSEPTKGSPALPCIAVDDMTDSPMDMVVSPLGSEKPILAHTARPPMELMEM